MGTLVVCYLHMEKRLNIIQSHLSTEKPNKQVMAKHSNPISSHILDTASGLPASGVSINLEEFEPITYRMRFDIKEYFQSKGAETFYPYAEIVFEIKDPKAHYHIPLLLSPFGYT